MIIFLYGSDSYRRQKKLNKYIEEYRRKYSGLSYDCFDLDSSAGQEEFLRLKEFASQQLIFDNKKLAAVRNIYPHTKRGLAFSAQDSEVEYKKLQEFFKRYLNLEDFTILISEDSPPPAELKFLLKKAFSVDKFDNLEGEEWRFFIQKEARQRKISLTSQAINFLAGKFQEDVWGLINELEKLSLGSEKGLLDVKELGMIGNYEYQSPNIFDFINAVSGNWPILQKITVLEKLFLGQEEPVKIFNILASQNRLPIKIIQKLADYDAMVKSGKIDYEEVLLDLALQAPYDNGDSNFLLNPL